MQKQRVKTSMSVPEMGKMLGLGKVESYKKYRTLWSPQIVL